MVYQYRPQWAIAGAGPSESVLHLASTSADLPGAAAAIRDFFDDIKAVLPDNVIITFPAEVTEIDTNTGQLVGFDIITPPAQVQGTATGAWVGGAGAVLRWETNSVINGRRVVGRTFIVPMAAANFETDGTPSSGTITLLQTEGNALLADLTAVSSPLRVYSRANTAEFDVDQAVVPNRSAILRERRDG